MAKLQKSKPRAAKAARKAPTAPAPPPDPPKPPLTFFSRPKDACGAQVIYASDNTNVGETFVVEKPYDGKPPGPGKPPYPRHYVRRIGDLAIPFSDSDDFYIFPTAEAAFKFVTTTWRACVNYVEKRPLPEAVQQFLGRRARELNDRVKAAHALLRDLRIEREELLRLAKAYGTPHAEMYLDGSDLAESVRELLAYEYGKRPFFSEACLYALVGKDDARAILGLLRSVLELVQPDQAQTL